MIRLAFDGTPLLGPRSGVGAVVAGVLPELARRRTLDITAYALTLRGRHELIEHLPPGVRAATRATPARLVRQSWLRTEHPKVEHWTGPVDVVHATNYVGPPTRGASVVSVYDLGFVHTPDLVERDALEYPQLLRRAIARGAWIHATSDHVRAEILAAFRVPPERVVRVYPGVPPTRGGDAVRGRALANAARYVLTIGTIEPRKNLPVLVRAFDEVADEDDDLVLVVAGGRGWGSEQFDAAVRAARHPDRIRVPGYVTDDQRADLLSGASVLAYPSRHEGFGFPPLEAMAAGVPVVATTGGSVPEVVGDAADLVEPDDVDGLAAALQRMLDDTAVASALVARGRARHDEFTWARAADGLLAMYEAAVA